MNDSSPELEFLDKESEDQLPLMSEVIAEELAARIWVNDDNVRSEEWQERVSEIAADALLNKFAVRLRGEDNPRTRWRS